MARPISEIFHEFLHERRLVAEVARRMGKNSSTLGSELNPGQIYAKFGIDDLPDLCAALRDLGYSKEVDGILHEYFDSLQRSYLASPSTDELLPLVSTLMEKTGALANSVARHLNHADENELRQVAAVLRSSLLPTTLRLGHLIDSHLNRTPGIDETSTEPQS